MTRYQNAPLMSQTSWPCGNCQICPFKQKGDIIKSEHWKLKRITVNMTQRIKNIYTLQDALNPHFTCVFPSSLCVFLHLVHDLYPPSASRQTSPYFCACLCVFSRPRAGPEGPVEGDWGYGALSSCCGFLSKTWLKNDGRYLSEPHQICRSHILFFFPTW